jgi:hypothetical protein
MVVPFRGGTQSVLAGFWAILIILWLYEKKELMRVAGSLAVVFILLAVPASACQTCNQYFNYESDSWCLFCDEANCGWFNCWIIQPIPGSADYCTGDDSGCFTNGKHCAREPLVELPEHLNDKWRLDRVRVYRVPATTANPQPTVSGQHG